MAEGPRYHSFIDDTVCPGQAPSATSGYSVQVGGLGGVHFPNSQDGSGVPHDVGEEVEEIIVDDASSIDENYDVHSISSSIEDQLT